MCRAPAGEPFCDRVAEAAGHSHKFETEGQAEAVGPVSRLPLRALVIDPAVLVFVALHALAFATPLLYRPTWRDVALVLVSYTLRMWGEWRPSARRKALAHNRPPARRHHGRLSPPALAPLFSDVATSAGARQA